MSQLPNRLSKKEFLSRSFRTTRTPYFSLKAKKNTVQKRRVGVIVGKAVHKSAVKRNFWRRQAKVVFADLIAPGNDFLIIFFPKINELTKQEFRAALTKAVVAFRQ
jgi:ribonuclease P protein component